MPRDSTSPAETRCDVLIIGGGPAGSTAATLLAERVGRVILLEKDRHPLPSRRTVASRSFHNRRHGGRCRMGLHRVLLLS
jgi:glycine/D-amino acid oxidase-like deaminating enzyme